jgi:hypothetical protein
MVERDAPEPVARFSERPFLTPTPEQESPELDRAPAAAGAGLRTLID